MSLPPLVPKVDAILVLDGDGTRVAGKYYGNFLKSGDASTRGSDESTEELRRAFERQLQAKITGLVARPDAAEVVTVQGRTVVVCGSGTGTPNDVRVVHVGPSNESELVLAHLCEGMFDALSQLMGGSTDRTMVIDNLELVFLLIDEHCDGGIILETDGSKLAGAVLLRDEDTSGAATDGSGAGMPKNMSGMPKVIPGMPPGVTSGDMTIGQAFRQARDQWLSGAI